MTPANPTKAETSPKKITRADIESKFRELTNDVDDRADEARSTVMTVAAVAGAVILVGVFLYGRRRGRKRTTVIEVRRF